MGVGGKNTTHIHTHTHEILATGSRAKSQNKKCNSGISPSASGRITFDRHGDGRVLPHQVATGKQFGGLGGVAALDIPDAVAKDAVRVQPQLTHWVNVNDVLLEKIK